jgi:glycine cleavage system H protein
VASESGVRYDSAMTIPENLRYTSDHEWARLSENGIAIGITDFAQEALGDVVFVDLPTIGSVLNVGDKLGEVESTKSVSEVYAPITGTVIAINEALGSAPETINTDPYGEGWFCVIEPTGEDGFAALLDAAAYTELTDH